MNITNFKVLKPFIAKNGKYIKPGDDFDATTFSPFVNALIEEGFIQPVTQEPKSDGEWRPKKGGTYYVSWPDHCGISCYGDYTYDNDEIDEALFDQGLAFETPEGAKKMSEWLKAVKVLRQDSEKSLGGKRPAELGETFYVWWNTTRLEWSSLFQSVSGIFAAYNPFPFATVEDAKASIKEHEKEWRTFLGVEDA